MRRRFSRRDFVRRTGAAAGLAAAVPRTLFGRLRRRSTRAGRRPRGRHRLGQRQLVQKAAATVTCVEKAFTLRMTQGAGRPRRSRSEGVNIVELDPEDYSVGYGGAAQRRRRRAARLVAACTGRRSAPAASPRSKACARRRWSRRR